VVILKLKSWNDKIYIPERSGIMNTVCYEIKDFEEILPELEIALGRLSDDLIGHELSWI
jgi:hypothetical protein